jgi:hypothetical protein
MTSKMLFPMIKISYEESLPLKDDVNLLLEKHYETSYNTNEKLFLDSLDQERDSFTKGSLI